MAFGNIGTIWAEIGLETRRLQAGVTTAKMQLSTLDRQALTQTASINAKLNKIGAGLTSVGKNMSKFVTLPILAVGAASVKAGMDFDSGMTKSLAIMNNITPQIRRQMELTAKDVVKYTTFSAKEGADAYFYLASAGLDAAQSIEALPRVAKFAQAGQFDLALATDLLTDAQSALGLTIRDDVVKNMKNMTRVSDVLVKANTLSNATVQQFSESLTNKAGAALKLLNKDIEEGVAVLAAWADQGVKGSEAGNWLNIVLRDLQRSAIENGEAFEKFGVNVFDTSGNVRNIADVIGDLETALDGMSDKEKRATLMMLGFQDRSISAMMTLLGTSDAIRGYEKDLRSATGFTENVAEKQMESFAAQVEQLKNELINVGISIFDILRPRLMSLVEQIKKAIDWFDSLTDTQKNLVVNLGIFAAAIGPVAYALSGLTKIVVGLNTVITALAVKVGVSAGVMGGFITAIAAGLFHFGVSVRGLVRTIKDLEEGTASVTKTFLNFVPFVDTLGVKIWKLMGATDEQIEKMLELAGVTEEQILVTDKAINCIEKYRDIFPEAALEIDKLGRQLEIGAINQTEYDDAVEETSKNIKEYILITKTLNSGEAERLGLTTKLTERQKELIKELGLTEEAMEALGIEIDDTTSDIDDQTESVDDLRGAFNELIDDIFGGITTYNDFQEAGWAVEEAEKALAEAIKEHGIDSVEAMKAQNNLDDAMIANIKTAFELSKEIEATTEEQEEARKKAIELGLQYVATGDISIEKFKEIANEFGMSTADILEYAEKNNIDINTLYKNVADTGIENFIALAEGFGLSGQQIMDKADELGISVDTATRLRVLDIDADTTDVDKAIKDVTNKANKLDGKVVTITFKGRQIGMMGAYSMGGIVKAYSSGGIIGNDGARLPILSAAYGIVTPQTGREIPVLAHENEVILNTGQQKNLAELIFNAANTRPNNNISNQPILIRNVLELDGQVIYEKTSEYLYAQGQTKQRGVGIK